MGVAVVGGVVDEVPLLVGVGVVLSFELLLLLPQALITSAVAASITAARAVRDGRFMATPSLYTTRALGGPVSSCKN
jgi:hypothetical protein